MKKIFEKTAFTLAEMMITLSIIGVLAAILVPIVTSSSPNENVMKFKKAHTTLAKVITTLVNSDQYYCNGDLGVMADCNTLIMNFASAEYDRHRTYFCNTFADVISAKKINCHAEKIYQGYRLANNEFAGSTSGIPYKLAVTSDTINKTKKWFDTTCKSRAKDMGQEIIATDGIVYYNAATSAFGHNVNNLNDPEKRLFSPPGKFPANYGDEKGFDIAYKLFCVDIDGFDETKGSASCDDKKDICPFGYGIRADGKILNGARAEEWLKKDLQKK